MAVRDLWKQAPGLVVLWAIAAMMVLLLFVLYIIQRQHINKGERTDLVRSLGNAIGGVGIALCVAAGIWIILLVGLMRDARNVWADPSSIYVSRSNILANWFTSAVTTKTGQPITGYAPPADETICYTDFSKVAGPETYDTYKALIKAYGNGNGTTKVTQTYEAATSTQFPPIPADRYTEEEDLATQQKLSLAYYRYIYCTQSYFQDIINKRNLTQNAFPFLSSAALTNLAAGKSSCEGLGNIPDTQPCEAGTGIPGQCPANPCFTALNETIAAQCLFYDDHVYSRINTNATPRGVLEAFGLTNASTGNPVGIFGYQVRAPAAA